MSSPQARRRQRSTRLVVAGVLIALAVLAVAGSVPTRSWLLVSAAAGLCAVLGAAATRITYAELLQSRRDAARDRAEQAQAYRVLTEERVAEHARYTDSMNQRAARQERALTELEEALTQAQTRAAGATRRYQAAERRVDAAESDRAEVAAELAGARTDLAEAELRITDLEQQIDVLRAELDAWHTAEPVRKHA